MYISIYKGTRTSKSISDLVSPSVEVVLSESLLVVEGVTHVEQLAGYHFLPISDAVLELHCEVVTTLIHQIPLPIDSCYQY